MFLRAFHAVFIREIRRIGTSRDLLLFCFAAPLLYSLMLSSVYVGKRVEEVRIGVVNQDTTALSRAFVRAADATQNVRVFAHYRTGGAAVDAMVRGDITGLLYIPRDFSAGIKRGTGGTCLVSIDSSNFMVANPAMQALLEVSGTLSSRVLAQALMKKGMPREQAAAAVQPLALVTETVVNPALNYADFMLPGLLLVVVQQILLVGLGYTIAEERENNREAELLRVAQGNHLALLLGKVLPYAVINFLFAVLFVYGLLPIFGIVPGSSIAAILLFLAVFIIAMTAFGVMISSFFKSVTMALIVLMFYSMPTFLISGFSWPRSAMPFVLRVVAFIFPSTCFLSDVRMLILGTVPFSSVVPSVAALGMFTVVCLAIAYGSFVHLFRRRLAVSAV